MSNKIKTKKVKRLLELLGVDPNELAPSSIDEAKMINEINGGSPVYIKSNVRLDNDCKKVCFTSESSCQEAINHRLRVGSNASSLRAYWCNTCSSWHMTSSHFYS